MSRDNTRTQHDPALIAQRPQPVQAYLDPKAVEWLLFCFANDKQLFDEARLLIQPHHFLPVELPIQLLYESLCRSYDMYNGANYQTLTSIAGEILESNPAMLLTDQQRDIVFRPDEDGLIYQLCQPIPEVNTQTSKNFSRALLQRFAHERTIVAPLRRVLNPGNVNGVPANLNTFLETIATQHSRLATLNDMPVANLTPAIGTPLVSPNIIVKTGVAFYDEAFGGQRVGDCNGLLGPTGGGKTTLAVHMAVANVKQACADAAETGTEPDLTVFITAEESAERLRPRFWSAFFSIPRRKLDNISSWDQMTQPGMLDPYELKMQANQEYKLSEIERYQAYAPQMETGLLLLDLSGSAEFPNAGIGYVDEITSYLSRINRKIRSVYIDYAGIFCERYMWANKLGDDAYRYLLKTFGDQCRQKISVRFNCTTWVLHQLRGAVNKSRPEKLMHHSEAGESADFANNMAICGCLGTADPITGCRRLNWSKTRHVAATAITPPTLRIHDDFAIMEDVTNMFTISPSGQFLSPTDRSQIGGLDALEHHTAIGGTRGNTSSWGSRAEL